MLLAALYISLLVTVGAVPHYYIIVRLSEPGPHPVSAQFKLLQPANSSRVWDCVSGLTPIVYPVNDNQVVKAQSIDMTVGSVVECLGLNVRVVESEHVPRWQGEDTSCPGLITSTTKLERSDSESQTTEYFQLTPPTLFRVFIARPSEGCVSAHVLTLAPPALSFSTRDGLPHSCSVISANLSLVSCNLTILTPEQDVVATAVGTVEVRVPSYVWKVPVASLECRCSCLITGSDTGALRTRSIFHNTTLTPSDTTGILETFTTSDTTLTCKSHIIVIGVVSSLLLIVGVAALFLWNKSRDLRRKLDRITGKRCRVTGMKSNHPPDFHPPDMDYERIHQCHHYNTLSLRLGDSQKELVKRPDTFPVYQKLPCDECESL